MDLLPFSKAKKVLKAPLFSHLLGTEVLAIELKVNYLRPARGPELLAIGEVIHAGRRLAVCRAEVREGGAGPGHGGPQGLRWPAWTPSTPSSWGSCRA